MKLKPTATRICCVLFAVGVFYFSTKMIIDVKATEFKHNNNLITTIYNNNIIDSVKFQNNSYRLYLNDDDIKSIKLNKQGISDENIKLLNRMCFQDIAGATKEFIIASASSIIEYTYMGNNLYYFKINNDIPITGPANANHSNEMEFKVSSDFSNSELKAIKKEIKKNKKKYFK